MPSVGKSSLRVCVTDTDFSVSSWLRSRLLNPRMVNVSRRIILVNTFNGFINVYLVPTSSGADGRPAPPRTTPGWETLP